MNSINRGRISARFQQAFDVISASMEFAFDAENNTDKRNLNAAVFPEIQFLLRVLIDDEFFIGAVLSKCSEEPSDTSHSFVKLLLLIIRQLSCECLNVTEKWFAEDLMGTTVIDLLFKHLSAVTGEIMSSTITGQIFYPSYDQICTKVCELLPVIPVRSFCVLENSLISNIFNENIMCSMLACDVWFFLMLKASDDLRLQHCKLLFKLIKISSGFKQRNVKVFLERVLPLLSQLQIEQLMKEFNPMKNPEAWNQSYSCEAEKDLCISFLQNYDYRKSYPNILPFISSFISKAENIDDKHREKLIFIVLIALKHNIEEKDNIDSIPELLNALSRHTTYLHRDVLPSLSYSLCYSNFRGSDTFKYIFCQLCSLFIDTATTGQQGALVECLVKCCSEQCSHYTKNLLYGHLLYLCTVLENLDKICPLINSKPKVMEGLIEFIETKKNYLSNRMTTDEKESLIRKIYTVNQSDGV